MWHVRGNRGCSNKLGEVVPLPTCLNVLIRRSQAMQEPRQFISNHIISIRSKNNVKQNKIRMPCGNKTSSNIFNSSSLLSFSSTLVVVVILCCFYLGKDSQEWCLMPCSWLNFFAIIPQAARVAAAAAAPPTLSIPGCRKWLALTWDACVTQILPGLWGRYTPKEHSTPHHPTTLLLVAPFKRMCECSF